MVSQDTKGRGNEDGDTAGRASTNELEEYGVKFEEISEVFKS